MFLYLKSLEFIESYFFLLQIRYENKLVFELDAKEAEIRKIMMPPCTLQTVVENAIKHNEFSAETSIDDKIIVEWRVFESK